MRNTFSILSQGAALIEVDEDNRDRENGLFVPDGVPTIAPPSSRDFSRRWRVAAPSDVDTVVTVVDSPEAARIAVRRCITRPAARWWGNLVLSAWPVVGNILEQHSSQGAALRHALAPFVEQVQPCVWQDVGTSDTSKVTAAGGDIVILTFGMV